MNLNFLFLSVVLLIASGDLLAQEIKVDASQVTGRVSRLLTGACIEDVNHEIYGGIYSQMIFGESFQEPPPAPTLAGFKAHGGRWLLNDGVVQIQATDGPKLVSDRPAFKDGAVGVEVKFADRQGVNAGLIVRVDKLGVGADRFIGYEIALDAGRRRLVLARHRNNFEPIKDVPCEVAVGRWIPLEVNAGGLRSSPLAWMARPSCGTTTARICCPRARSDCGPGRGRRTIAACG